jgi:rfaE bifunctional protein kinase chain/domain/rfaE bifunctional protein nucleotidyltransferase chain/domain
MSHALQLGHSKILELEDLAAVVKSLRAEGKTVVQCHGVFDLMHIGHIRHFEKAKEMGHVLIVTITPDRYVNKGPNRPVFTEKHRAWSIGALECVDYVGINRWPTAIEAIELLRPQVFVKGAEYRDAAKDRTGNISREERAVQAGGGRLAYTDDIVFSSSSLLNRFFGVFNDETAQFLAAFSAKHSADYVLSFVDGARPLKTLVIGEAIIDEYQYCETIGKSGKEPVLVARYVSSERFPGGILAIANHAGALSDRVAMLTSLGEADSQEEFVRDSVKSGIDRMFLYMDKAPTIVKKRFLESYPFQKLFEVYVMGEMHQPQAYSASLCERLSKIIADYDAVIVADYGHGMVTPAAADLLCEKAKFLAINTQVNAGNTGFNTISKYRRADYICVSERELRLEARSREKDLRELVQDASNRFSCPRLMITRGERGSLLYSKGAGFSETPAFTGRVVDRVGAGDAVFAITALCAVQNAPIDVMGFIGNCVGAQAVGVVGNRTSVDKVSLSRYIECLMK